VKRYAPLLCAAILFCVVFPLSAAEKEVEALLPADCGPEWRMEGPVSTYTKENLYKYIDGEAELYMPYGFEKAATVMYVRPGNKESGLVVNIFKMGSLLDAFGIYANYRSPSLDRADVGSEGFVDESQLMFFQDRYFIQIMTSGALTLERPLFLTCAASVAGNLPNGSAQPRELALVKAPGLVAGTEKYFPEGLLGYGFLGRGLTAEVMLKGDRVKAFVVLGNSKEGATRAFDAYVKYLSESKAAPQISRGPLGSSLHVVDPLFKNVVLEQSGQYAIGLTGLKSPHDGDGCIEEWLGRLGH
jgi:hypothetical protein